MYSLCKTETARLVHTQALVARAPLGTPPARGRPGRTRTRGPLAFVAVSLGGGPIDAFRDVVRAAAAVFAAAAFFVAVVGAAAAVCVVVVVMSLLRIAVVGAAAAVGVVVVVVSLSRACRRRPCSSVAS